MEIVQLSQLLSKDQSLPSAIHQALSRVFLETSMRKEFSSETDRQEFQFRYLDYYLQYPQWVWLLVDVHYAMPVNALTLTTESILGYLVASPATPEEVFHQVPSLELFRAEISSQYPAHLHINLTERARGSHQGSQMLLTLERALSTAKIPGVHLITTVGARNVSFYLKNDYVPVKQTSLGSVALLMLGKKL